MRTTDVRFTQGKDGAIYVFITAVPRAGEILQIRSLGLASIRMEKPVKSLALLGSEVNLKWKQESESLVIEYPSGVSMAHGVVFRVK